MNYIDDDNEIKDSLAALDHVKNWAYEQMGNRRQPRDASDSTMGDPRDDAQDEGDVGEHSSARDPRLDDEMGDPRDDVMDRGDDMEQPMDQPRPRDFGGRDRTLTVIATGSKAPKKPDSSGMDEWTNETVKKLDRFGKKLPKR